MVEEFKNKKEKPESIRIIRPAISEGKPRPEKKHYFQYKQEYIKQMQNKEKIYDNKHHVNEEFKVLNKIGFAQKGYDNMTNTKLLNFDMRGRIDDYF